MAKIQEQLEQRIGQLEALLRGQGIITPAPPRTDKERADYIEWGSEAHMALLGLVYVNPDEKGDYITHEQGGKTYRLEDEVTAFVHFHDPRQVAKLVLRQKAGELLSTPHMPRFADAPLWTPEPMDGIEWEQRQYAVMA